LVRDPQHVDRSVNVATAFAGAVKSTGWTFQQQVRG